MNDFQVSPAQLFQIIGQKEVENQLLRERLAAMQAAVAGQHLKEVPSGQEDAASEDARSQDAHEGRQDAPRGRGFLRGRGQETTLGNPATPSAAEPSA